MLPLLKTIFLITVICHLPSVIFAQKKYWQQQVNYSIDVLLNDKEHTLDGFAHIEYINNSPDTIKYIWFHLWPNAYKNDKTAFSEQLLENGNTKFYFSNKDDRGYINRIDFKVNNITAEVEDHPQHIDIVKLLLPAPLPPGQKVNIATPFHVKLPYNFSRGGHDGQSYQVTQWYPKPAVYDHKGWHAMPYLDQGEFYSEFGSFDVKISLPKNYVVAATGQLQDGEEKEWLRSRESLVGSRESGAGSHELEKKTQTKKTETNKRKNTNPKPAYRAGGPQTPHRVLRTNFPPSDPQFKTIQFKQDKIHDFAWFADKRFIVNHDTCKLLSGKVIDIFTYYTPQQKQYWQNSVQFGKDAIRFYSQYVGEYPYNVVSAVQGPETFAGGMEYPTITVISPVNSVKDLDHVIAHEIGHNWFYGILASNERRHAWMDEGINSFYDNKYYTLKYGKQLSPEPILFETTATVKTDQPIETPSENFNTLNYGLTAYYKSAEWMRLLESQSGSGAFNKAMQEYYQHWQFKHPYPEDFKKVMEESTKKNLDSTFVLLNRTGTLPNQKRSGSTLAWVVNPRYKTTFLNNRSKDLVTLSPVPGYNSYDKFLAGILITNIKLPPTRFQFLILPMYATGSKKPAGIGKLNYSFYPDNSIRKVNLFVSGSSFSMNEYTDDNGLKTILSFQKIVPGIKLTAKEKNARSTINKYIQWKTFFINEDALTFPIDTIINGPDTTILNRVEKEETSRTLNQLKIAVENYRTLYPFRAELNAEHAKGLIRLGFTGNYFFNYTSNTGGVDIRLFAGKFFYLNKQKANVFLYGLNLSAPKGNMDYTYSDYFIGRNEYPFRNNGVQWTIPYQQIMIRDGGLKMNTDAQGNIGSSDDWLSAINASFDIPSRINPLSVLPFKIPLKIFADIGTYAEAWKKVAETDRFLYNAGIQISLLKEIINIYIPVVYSPVFKDYVKSVIDNKNRFLKTISFTIDISKFNTKKLIRELPL